MGDNDDCRFDATPYLTGPDPSKPLKATITTRRYDGKVEQDTDIMGHVTRRMMNIREMQADHAIRDVLIGLGWTPPDGDAFLAGVKAGLEAAARYLENYQGAVPPDVWAMRAMQISATGIRLINPATVTRKGGADE